MPKILLLSVGGSPEPVVNTIKKNKPDFVYFFCSSGARGSAATIDGPGEPCGEKRETFCPECGHAYYLGTTGKSIASRAHLEKSRYEIVTVDDPDDLDDCYEKLLLLTKQIEEVHGGDSQIIANYTGGTKTMSVAMFMVGLMTEKWDLAVNIGQRTDLIKVRAGDVPIVIGKWRIFCQTQLNSIRKSIGNFDFKLCV